MQYVVSAGGAGASPTVDIPGWRLLADGEAIVMEGPWPFARTVLGCVADESALADGAHSVTGYAVQGLDQPGQGKAFVIAAHKLLDPDGFRPYAEAIPGLLEQFGVRSLARGGKVTPLAGGFAPDRAVILQFPSVEAAIAFYTADAYAPLLALRLRTSDPRFMIIARSGAVSAAGRIAAEAYLAAHPR